MLRFLRPVVDRAGEIIARAEFEVGGATLAIGGIESNPAGLFLIKGALGKNRIRREWVVVDDGAHHRTAAAERAHADAVRIDRETWRGQQTVVLTGEAGSERARWRESLDDAVARDRDGEFARARGPGPESRARVKPALIVVAGEVPQRTEILPVKAQCVRLFFPQRGRQRAPRSGKPRVVHRSKLRPEVQRISRIVDRLLDRVR